MTESFSGTDVASEPGLSADELRDRVARGLVNDVPDRPSRTVSQIVRAKC